ncbi:hypothetical protein [Leifsonia shinshuensis]|uniref:VapC45 PIN like domain-containing protein n=1 Tax=Leifsonia shinshuensis TaxID=150026 RepID=A0A853CYG0_9MICO|nr:hypothetical protein [Leifsonia shinshuensis]
MKIYLDENLPYVLAEPLSVVYREHVFSTHLEEGLTGTEDIPLLTSLRARGFEAFVTRDRAQLRDPDERKAVINSGLRWVGVADKRLKGLEQITVTVATLVAGLRVVIEHAPEGPTSYALKTVQHGAGQLVTIRDIRG